MDTPETENSNNGESVERPGFFYRIHGNWIEVVAAVLLALAVIASAWSAYQSSRWGGVEARNFCYANADRILAAEEADIAEQEFAIDVEMFVEFTELTLHNDQEAIEYFENILFRDEMKVAIDAWLATDPWNTPGAPDTPFDMPQYKNENREESKVLQKSADDKQEMATQAIEQSDRYVLFTVLFASVLFFAGISTKFKAPHVRILVLVMGGVLFTTSFVFLCFQNIH
ncbi:MAG: hypothetical protein KKB90_06040 [Actinobacteria bacterium]|nr:hypothetical protein [Actinomycetota bacterium]MCG2817796.1 hypothetical protein [Actinomycetes bacterium]MBU4178660.1 hypothetical protein [Actinomycetota bacterium]MBU4218508.1 hypothetical protein [Actinomycetota bacterium]MBU4359827.1 hypothetical protein [Actinomycetota bacterium]